MADLNPTRIRRLAKEGFWIVLGQLAVVLGSLVLVRVLTEHLTPAEYGQLALGLTISGLFGQVIFGGIGGGIGRYYSIAAERSDLEGYLSASRRLLTYATIATLVVSALLQIGLQATGLTRWCGLATAATLFGLLSAYNSTLNGIQNAARQRAIVSLHGGLDAWLKILFALWFLHWLGSTSAAVVLGYAGSVAVVILSQLTFLRRTIPRRSAPDPEPQPTNWAADIWRYAWPFSTWGVFTWMHLASDRWALQSFASTADVGQYAVLYQLGYAPIGLLTGMVTTFFGPILFQRSGDAANPARNAGVHRITWTLMMVSILATVFFTIFLFAAHHWVFLLFVSEQYRKSSGLLPWFALAGGLFAAGQMLSLKLMSEMQTLSIASAKIATALLGVLLNVAGAMLAGLNGVVGALVCFSLCFFLWMAYLARAKP